MDDDHPPHPTGDPRPPSETFADLLTANRRHRDSFTLAGLPGRAAKGLAVVTCIDSRLDPLPALGLAPGDAKIIRNAGARATDDAIRSLALATALLGVERIAVIVHTHCAMASATADELRARVAQASGGDATGWEPLSVDDQLAVLDADVELIRRHPLIPARTVVAGFVYDVDTGELRSPG
jgi:carbonic anhydrase